ncbi:MAG: type I-C CRISPR-associated endonuclease Cas1c [Desulfovibrio sp.]|nr:type I-C CRISPR-associated endonuclease Cas1c [Desulfovibrio sp.]
MKRLLNTLYITSPKAWLAKEGECVAVSIDGALKGKIPIHTLDGLVLFGPVSCSPFLLGHCAENGVSVSWLTENGKFLAAMHGPVSGNVLLRKAQYAASDREEFYLPLVRSFILGKIYNCRTVLRRTARARPSPDIDVACDLLSDALKRLQSTPSLDVARGIEGEAARTYFSVFNALITADDPAFAFNGRNRRPPLDAVNCLLSFVYTLLAHDIRSALEAVGLDPAVGFLHRLRPGRASLALDVMEELRPYLADRLVLTLINKGQVSPKDFTRQESGAVLMSDAARKTVLLAWQRRKADTAMHDFLQEQMSLGLFCHAQARLLARHIRGDLDAYPPVIIR